MDPSEITKLQCAVAITYECDSRRPSHFKGPIGGTSDPYIHCCAYTAPTMAISVAFLEHFSITSLDQLNSMLVNGELTVSDGITPLTLDTLTKGINEVVGHIFSHHWSLGTGIDDWIRNSLDSPQQQHHLFEIELHIGINLLSFYDPEEDYTVHHSFVYVSRTDPSRCCVVDSWAAIDNTCYVCRDLQMRQWLTAEVINALIQINDANDPSEIMQRIFLDPVSGGSCYSELDVVALKPSVINDLINRHFMMGVSGYTAFGRKKSKHKQNKQTNKTNKQNKQTKQNKTKQNKQTNKTKQIKQNKTITK